MVNLYLYITRYYTNTFDKLEKGKGNKNNKAKQKSFFWLQSFSFVFILCLVSLFISQDTHKQILWLTVYKNKEYTVTHTTLIFPHIHATKNNSDWNDEIHTIIIEYIYLEEWNICCIQSSSISLCRTMRILDRIVLLKKPKAGFYTSMKTFMNPPFPADGGVTAWGAFLSGECTCSNRCLIIQRECSVNGITSHSRRKKVHDSQRD